MGFSLAEQEFQVSFCADEDTICFTSSYPKYSNKLKKIAEALGVEVTYLRGGDTIRVYLPPECLLLREPPKKRELTEEQREQARERMRTLHTAKNGNLSLSADTVDQVEKF
ncbi:MAG TPA: hypothetical protein VE971_02170 [Candidatus Eisenbacteria bacterium]|nr:hypothetical protein [Candidatus Eisenbacteria bacterium]